jgi:hypothetical protein
VPHNIDVPTTDNQSIATDTPSTTMKKIGSFLPPTVSHLISILCVVLVVVQATTTVQAAEQQQSNLRRGGNVATYTNDLFSYLAAASGAAAKHFQFDLHDRSLQQETVVDTNTTTSNTTSSNITMFMYEVDLSICGACAVPLLGPLVKNIQSVLTNSEFRADVTVQNRSLCESCSAGATRWLQVQRELQAATQQTISLNIVQTPVPVIVDPNTTDVGGMLDVSRNVSTTATTPVDVMSVVNNATAMQILLDDVAEALLSLGITVTFTFAGVVVTVMDNTATGTATGTGDDQLTAGDNTNVPLQRNRMLKGRQYLHELGRILETEQSNEDAHDDLMMMDGGRVVAAYGDEGIVDEDLGMDDSPFQCRCVACEEDEHCGGLWYGSVVRNATRMTTTTTTTTTTTGTTEMSSTSSSSRTKVHIVISHCKSDLDWLDQFTTGRIVDSITVISKCGAEVRGAPEGTDIIM